MKKLTATALLILALLFSAPAWASDVTMHWTKDPVEDDLAGFKIYSTTDLQEGFTVHETLNDAAVREYTHTGIDGPCWWYVTAFDKSGNESGPSNIIDNVAPAPVVVRVEVIVQ